jgi:adenine-specific DNA-methyltransferase
MYPRLLLAKDLLRDDGVIFISIDDNEQAQLKLLCDEVFGEENFISQLVWEKKKKGTFLSNQIASVKEYILVYFKNKANAPSLIAEINTEIETYPCINPSNKRGERTFKSGMISKYRNKNIALPENTKISVSTMDIIYKNGLVIENGKLINDVIAEGNWRYSQELIDEYNENGDLYFTEDLYIRRIVKEPRYKALKDLLPRVGEDEESSFKHFDVNNLFIDGWGSNEDGAQELRNLFDNKSFFDYPKPKKLIIKLIASLRDKNAVILDFFAGSGTTAEAVMRLNAEDGGNRSFILVQIPQAIDPQKQKEAHRFVTEDLNKPATIFEITAERLRRAGQKIDVESAVDTGFRVFDIIEDTDALILQKPLSEVTQADLNIFIQHNTDSDNRERVLYNLLLSEGLPLTTVIKELIADTVYLADDVALILGAVDLTLLTDTLKALSHSATPAVYLTVYAPWVRDDNFMLGLKTLAESLGFSSDKLRLRG